LNPIPSLTALCEDGLQVTFKQSTGIVEVLFGVSFGVGDAVKRFVEDADDALLFAEGRECNYLRSDFAFCYSRIARPFCNFSI
jgi:hypothetical protein